VEHDPKDVTNNKKNKKSKKNLTKSEIYIEIFSNFGTNAKNADEIFKLLKSIDMEITAETIEKAKKILEIASSENLNDGGEGEGVVKGEGSEEDGKEIVKGEGSEEEGEDEMESMQKAYDKMKSEMATLEKKMAESKMKAGAENGSLNKSEIDTFSKSEMTDLIKSITDEVSKSMAEKFTAVGELVLAKDEEIGNLKKSIDSLVDFNEALNERLNVVEKTPVGGKAIVKGYVERFDKEDGVGESNAKVYSVSNPSHKKELLNILEEMSNINKGENIDESLVKAMTHLEIASTMDMDVIQRLKAKNISVTR
jgi:hypothetical protein